MRIGELARATGTRVDTIRHYEKAGLLPRPARSDGNYRLYGPADEARLRFVRACRDLDLSLDEIRALLRVSDAPAGTCGGAEAVLDAHLGHVRQRLRALRALERDLVALRARCGEADDAARCGILAALDAGPRPAGPGRPAEPDCLAGAHPMPGRADPDRPPGPPAAETGSIRRHAAHD
ncbi:MAG: Cd(II)/Pb(II)-responsive transcriptional regulator [Burkholderiales bacterium]